MYAVFLHFSERTLEENVSDRVRRAPDAWTHTLADAVEVARATPGIEGATIWERDVLVAIWTRGETDRGVAHYLHGRAPS